MRFNGLRVNLRALKLLVPKSYNNVERWSNLLDLIAVSNDSKYSTFEKNNIHIYIYNMNL